MKFTTPIEMPRGTHYGSNYFIVYSHEIKRNVKLYSNLEYYNFLSRANDLCQAPDDRNLDGTTRTATVSWALG